MGTSTFAASSTLDVDYDDSDKGVVKVKFNTGSEKKIKLLIQSGEDKYYYNLSNDEAYVNFPLQFGDGSYTAVIYENTTGSKYKKLHTESFQVDVKEDTDIFLNSIQEVDWDEEDQAIVFANKLVEEATEAKQKSLKNTQASLTDQEVIDLMYNYVVENIDYDYQKIKGLDYSYLPDIDSTLETGTGICYDYSSLLASMLRSQGIPAKLVKGYTNWTDVYHAWNEVYLADEERWVIVDSTYDAYMYKKGRSYSMEKDVDVYSKKKEL